MPVRRCMRSQNAPQAHQGSEPGSLRRECEIHQSAFSLSQNQFEKKLMHTSKESKLRTKPTPGTSLRRHTFIGNRRVDWTIAVPIPSSCQSEDKAHHCG